MANNAESTTGNIASYKAAFLQDCLTANVLSFGDFTLKSGRQSPYFFNATSLYTADLLSPLARGYAHAIQDFLAAHPSMGTPDVLFGPAYKGIPIVVATLLELHRLDPARFGRVGYSFNRKEAKDHGEGGSLVGAPLAGQRVLVLDDVLTAGTAMRQTIELVTKAGGSVVGFFVALDRLECKPGGESLPAAERVSAMGEIRRECKLHTGSIASLDDLIALLKGKGLDPAQAKRLEEYRAKYGSSD